MKSFQLTIMTVGISLVIVFCSMILHELAHGLTAYFLGDDTAKSEGRLTLNPLKHLDPYLSVALPLLLALTGGPIFGGAKPVPVDSRNLRFGVWGMALVAVAGPLTNFLLAFLIFMIGYFTGGIFDTGMVGYCFFNAVIINLSFGVFNLLPIPPLDGSRVIYAIAPDAVRNVMDRIERFGIWIVMLLVVLVPSFVNLVMGGAVQGILDFFCRLVGIQ